MFHITFHHFCLSHFNSFIIQSIFVSVDVRNEDTYFIKLLLNHSLYFNAWKKAYVWWSMSWHEGNNSINNGVESKSEREKWLLLFLFLLKENWWVSMRFWPHKKKWIKWIIFSLLLSITYSHTYFLININLVINWKNIWNHQQRKQWKWWAKNNDESHK